MMAHYGLNLLIWRKLTPAQQTLYLEGFLKHTGVDSESPKTPEEMFTPEEESVIPSG